MSVGLIRTGDVTHLAVWVADHDESKRLGWRYGSSRPICGSTTEPTYPSTRVRWVWLDADHEPKLRKPCTRCAAILEQLVTLDAALRETYERQTST